MGTVTAYDSTDINTVPENAQYLMGYDSGHWQTYFQMVARFPKLAKAHRILSIAVQADDSGDILDCEPGDATPGEVAAWVEGEIARGNKRPAVYSSVSAFPEILSALRANGISRNEIRIWTAHYNFRPHLCGPSGCNYPGFSETADATQWTDGALGRNLDQSLCAPSFFGVQKAKPNHHYDWYYTKIELNKRVFNEREIAEDYDRLRDQPLSRIIPNRPKLKVLRAQCKELAERIAREALYDDKGRERVTPLWHTNHREFRYARLIHRSQGRRVV